VTQGKHKHQVRPSPGCCEVHLDRTAWPIIARVSVCMAQLLTLMERCRDRATANTESAIQNAHQNNHGGKAMEVVLKDAQQRGIQFCDALPLVPTMKDVRRMVSLQAKEANIQAPAGAAVRNPRRTNKVTDPPQDGELTYLVDQGELMRNGTELAEQVYNAVGFFLYTQCEGNPNGEWPLVLCAPHHPLLNTRFGGIIIWVCGVMRPAVDADSRDLLSASGRPPSGWDASITSLALGAMFKYTVFGRANLYGDSGLYVTSTKYRGQRTRNNNWVVFQHHVHWCALTLQLKGYMSEFNC
jgi:hypothetical protein